jgi:glyoxylase-like metal-dependent hydrolase (beta-lactamase superfamily II)
MSEPDRSEPHPDAPLEILPGFFFIERGYLNANHFAFIGKKPILVDTAHGNDFAETERSLSRLGILLSEVGTIINTHSHTDHVGGNRRIQEKSGCEIRLHAIGKHFIDTRDDWSTWYRYYDQPTDFFTCGKGLEAGDILELGPHAFEVVHTPGHSADLIVLYNKKEKILISSDALWENGLPAMTVRIEGSGAAFSALESMEKMEALDVKTVYPGHGKPFDDFLGAIARGRKILRKYLSNREEIGADLLKKIIVYILMAKNGYPEDAFFPYLRGTHWFRETIDLYFNGEYESKYREIMAYFFQKKIVRLENGILRTDVKR